MSVTYRVTHRTEYRYESDVAPSYSQLHLLPRDGSGQRCRSSEVVVDPAPEDYRVRTDFFGNRVAYVAIHEPHRVAERDLDERRRGRRARARAVALRAPPVGAGPRRRRRPDASRPSSSCSTRRSSRGPPRSRTTPAAASRRAATCSTPSWRCARRSTRDFAYKPGSTSVSTPLAEVFAARAGVCQDFAHLAIACLRSLGLPARYVSGYLETDPPPGRPKLTGADVSHAWLSVLVPGAGWLDVDPTNDQLVNQRYVVTAYGRDYSDVPPLHGVIFSEGRTQRMHVVVDVVALPA